MANTGGLATRPFAGEMYAELDWNITNIDEEAGTGTFNYKLYCKRPTSSSQTTKYWIYTTSKSGTAVNYCKINNQYVFRVVNSGGNNKSNPYNIGSGSTDNPYKLYTSDSSYDKTQKKLAGYSEPITNKQGYFLKVLAEGSIQISYDDDGYTSIPIEARFHCCTNTYPVEELIYTIVPDRINRYSRANRTTNSGSNWSKSVFVWKTTNGGSTWTKCNIYKTTNGGSTWTKIT